MREEWLSAVKRWCDSSEDEVRGVVCERCGRISHLCADEWRRQTGMRKGEKSGGGGLRTCRELQKNGERCEDEVRWDGVLSLCCTPAALNRRAANILVEVNRSRERSCGHYGSAATMQEQQHSSNTGTTTADAAVSAVTRATVASEQRLAVTIDRRSRLCGNAIIIRRREGESTQPMYVILELRVR